MYVKLLLRYNNVTHKPGLKACGLLDVRYYVCKHIYEHVISRIFIKKMSQVFFIVLLLIKLAQ